MVKNKYLVDSTLPQTKNKVIPNYVHINNNNDMSTINEINNINDTLQVLMNVIISVTWHIIFPSSFWH